MNGARPVPHDWIELTELFIDEVKLGVHAGWKHIPTDLGGECLFYTPPHGETQAWMIRRNRVLGTPIPTYANPSH